jgi:hypothetical protein
MVCRPDTSLTVQLSRLPIQPRHDRQKSGRTVHPLLGRFPLLVMALAITLVLFTLAMAQLKAGTDPDLGRGTNPHLVAKTPARTP